MSGAASGRSGAHILVVDDEPDVRFLLRMVFQGVGHTVSEARDGAAALREVESMLPSVIVTDLMMPVMDGRALIERLRADARTASIPILLISAGPIHDTGANAVMRKPFEWNDMLDVVRRLLEGRVA